MSSPHAHHAHTLADDVRDHTGLNPARCYQCGKCSAGCPMATETELRPHDVMRMVARGQRERLLGSESIWLCLTCETCAARCPNGCDPAATIDALRGLAVRADPSAPPARIGAFHRSFLDQIRTHGRVFEFGLVLSYKFRTGALFQDVLSAPGMMSRGKLGFSPQKVRAIDEVRRIFEACEAAAREEA
jgi:heterodisulfide reductase subunit C